MCIRVIETEVFGQQSNASWETIIIAFTTGYDPVKSVLLVTNNEGGGETDG